MKLFGLLSNFYCTGCQNGILRVHRSTLMINSSMKKKHFRKQFQTLSENFRPFVEVFSDSLWKYIQHVHRKPFVEEKLCNCFVSKPFSDLDWKFFGLLSISLRRGYQNCILCVDGFIFRTNSYVKTNEFFISFSDIEWNVSPFCQTFCWTGCQNGILSVHRSTLIVKSSMKTK